MTLRHLEIFCAVCAQGSFTRAAEKLNMAQPAVSAAVRELEEYYGVKLFDRISRRLYLTEAGKRFQQYASHVASLFDDMEKEMRDWEALGVLRIGASITIGSWLLPGYVKRFSKKYPGMDVRVSVEQSERLEKRLLNNELDFALMEGVVHEPGKNTWRMSFCRCAARRGPSSPGRRFPKRNSSSRDSFCGSGAAAPGRFSTA